MQWESALQLGIMQSDAGACILGVAQVHAAARHLEERSPVTLHAIAGSAELEPCFKSVHAGGSIFCVKALEMRPFTPVSGASSEQSDATPLSKQYVYAESWKCELPAPCGPTWISHKARVQRLVCQNGAGQLIAAAKVPRTELGKEVVAVLQGLALLQKAHAARNAKMVCGLPYNLALACFNHNGERGS